MKKTIYVDLADVREILNDELEEVNKILNNKIDDREQYNFLLGRRTELALLLERIK